MSTVGHRGYGAALALAALTSSANPAFAHVSLAGPGFAGARQVLTFSIGHGCEGADTYRLEVAIPKEVTTVRGMPGAFGPAQVTTDKAGLVTRVAWEKKDVRDADDQFYELSIRITVPETPFTKLYFPATQYCRDAAGKETKVEWAALPAEIAAAKEGEAPEPAPELSILPARRSGWNKYKVDAKITDLSVFADAQIVWVGDAAYSADAETMALIEAEKDVDVLSDIPAGAEVWVKY